MKNELTFQPNLSTKHDYESNYIKNNKNDFFNRVDKIVEDKKKN